MPLKANTTIEDKSKTSVKTHRASGSERLIMVLAPPTAQPSPTLRKRVAPTELEVPPGPITLSVYRLLEPPEDVWPKAMSN